MDKVAFKITKGKADGKMFLDQFMTYVVKVIDKEISKLPKPMDTYTKEEAGVLITSAIDSIPQVDLSDYVRQQVLQSALVELQSNLRATLEEKESTLTDKILSSSRGSEDSYKKLVKETTDLKKEIGVVQSFLEKEIDKVSKDIPLVKKEVMTEVSTLRDNVQEVVLELEEKVNKEIKKLIEDIKKLAITSGGGMSISGAGTATLDARYAQLSGAVFTGTIEAPEVIISSLTPTRIPYVDSDDSLTDSANLAFDGNRQITFGDANNLASIGKSNIFTNGAAGSNSFMAGHSNTLNLTGTANKGVAVGVNNSVTLATGPSSANSSAIGAGNVANGANTSAIGTSNTATADSSQAIGYLNSCTVDGSFGAAIGYTNQVTGSFGAAIGQFNVATGSFSAGIGLACEARADGAVAVGVGLFATATNAGIVGVDPNYAATNSVANTMVIVYDTTRLTLDASRLTATHPVRLPRYTVAGLPAGAAGDTAFVTNALAPAFGAAVAGGGAVGVPVYHDGVSWKVG